MILIKLDCKDVEDEIIAALEIAALFEVKPTVIQINVTTPKRGIVWSYH